MRITVAHNDGRNQTIDVGDTKIVDGTSVEFSSLGVSVGASGGCGYFAHYCCHRRPNAASRSGQFAHPQKISFGLQDLASDGALAIV